MKATCSQSAPSKVSKTYTSLRSDVLYLSPSAMAMPPSSPNMLVSSLHIVIQRLISPPVHLRSNNSKGHVKWLYIAWLRGMTWSMIFELSETKGVVNMTEASFLKGLTKLALTSGSMQSLPQEQLNRRPSCSHGTYCIIRGGWNASNMQQQNCIPYTWKKTAISPYLKKLNAGWGYTDNVTYVCVCACVRVLLENWRTATPWKLCCDRWLG